MIRSVAMATFTGMLWSHWFGWGEPMELEAPCFWYQFLVPEAGHQKLGSCVMGLKLLVATRI